MADYSMANRKIAYTLGRGRAYISDMSSTSGYMGAKYFQEFGPRFLACHVANVAWHGVSISIVSISSVSCRVRILRVSMFMPCHGHITTRSSGPRLARHSFLLGHVFDYYKAFLGLEGFENDPET